MRLPVIFIALMVLWRTPCLVAQAPVADYNFRHLGAAQGLADGVVRAIGQDRYGYIWIGTLSGLNRYDGYGVTPFYNNPNDSLSLPASTVRAICSDRQGNLWIGCETGLLAYDFAARNFKPVEALRDIAVLKIEAAPQGILWLLTSGGMYRFDPVKRRLTFYQGIIDVTDFHIAGALLYAATGRGLVAVNLHQNKARLHRLPRSLGSAAGLVRADGRGNIWYTSRQQRFALIRTNNNFSAFTVFTGFKYAANDFSSGAVTQLLIDDKGSLWCGTNINGLANFDYQKNRFVFYRHNPLRPASIAANLTTQIFQGRYGYIWVGTEGYGVDYFHPAQNRFQTLLPPAPVLDKLQSQWCRTLATDARGRYWTGYGYGLLETDSNRHRYRFFYNGKNSPRKLHDGSVRALLYDRDAKLWIATAGGINRLHTDTGIMDFFTAKDSLPETFYWALLQDRRDTIWFCGRDNLYYWPPRAASAKSVAQHPVLRALHGQGVRCMLQDSRGRLWFGMNGWGLACYNPDKGTLLGWQRTGNADSTLAGNLVVALAEDQKGVIWISSFTGLTAFDPATNRFKRYTQVNGLPSLKTSALAVDAQDRLWIGSTGGLLLLDKDRRRFKTFDLQDGLPTMEFSDMPATRLPDGRFAFPTVNGYVLFDPMAYHENEQQLQPFISGISTPNRGYTNQNPEDLQSLRLAADQNFFSLRLTALNYNNPEQTWYAYRLDGFDKNWVYTKERMVNYTNVPGGHYRFRYKATADPNNWPSAEKRLYLHVSTVFYKTPLFILVLAVLIAGALFLLYRYRLQQQRHIFLLQSKAQALEKEKASVMYESLKQQLNPHFLFNSLTSLGSLIQTDQKMAQNFLTGMSRIYRYILSNRDVELLPLKEELQFVSHYIQLQQARFESGLEVHINIPESQQHRRVAPVTLQNLVENAIKHNIIDDETPLVIHIFTDAGFLVVQNNLQLKKYVETSNKQGLKQLQSLYRYLTGEPVQVHRSDTHFTVKIPLI